ncbi:MAG: ornithine carbamoyltransferase [Candidatus Ancillula trichonymphae]|jgi:ornithine carbamoyltransferase|nr:ornithine carbamoyltransferase [Candidatus Ancillula trichonymphae]
MNRTRHFLRDDNLSPEEYTQVLELALHFKDDLFYRRTFAGPRSVAVIFDKNSTRTRASFAAGVTQLGGYPLMVESTTSQLSRGESICDTARVLERMVETIVWRTFQQVDVLEMAKHSSKPVINALTDEFHPCQVLADLATLAYVNGKKSGQEFKNNKQKVAGIRGKTLVYLGDGANNMAHSYLLGCATAGVNVRIVCPKSYSPNLQIVRDAEEIAQKTGAQVIVTDNVNAGIEGANVVATDAWLSMGMDKSEESERADEFRRFQITEELIAQADEAAVFMHCLPAYRGREVLEEVIDGPQSVVFEEAEFRLHAQKALMDYLYTQTTCKV